MNILFDAHCDTLQKICDFDAALRQNSRHLDLLRLKTGEEGERVQVFAAFIDKKTDFLPPFKRCMQLLSKYRKECELNKDIMLHCNKMGEVSKALSEKKIASLLSIEGGEAIEGSVDNLRLFYSLGVRALTLCWNYRNEIADGITEPDGRGLSKFGKNVVREMNSLGMLIDVSHISEKGFWDVLEYSQMPIAATHSNAKALKNHPRNLNDEQIKAIIKNDGCIGISIYPEFVSDGMCRTADIIRHIEYIMGLGGENNIGLGSDLDGIDALPLHFRGAEDLWEIPNELLKLGYSENLVKKVSSDNFLRLFKTVIG